MRVQDEINRIVAIRYHLILCVALSIAFSNLARADEKPKPSSDALIGKLIAQLGAESAPLRDTAETQLYVIGRPALERLNDAIRTTKQAEVRTRARQLVRKIMFQDWPRQGAPEGFSLVKAGVFLMGSPKTEKERKDDELQHTVRLTKPFLIANREVTQDEYFSIMKVRPSWFSPTGEGRQKAKHVKNTGSLPVESVTWFDAIEYCNRLSESQGLPLYYSLEDVQRRDHAIVSAKVKRLGGLGFRLPTEAEWEYVCRAGTTTSHHFGTLPRDSRRSKRGNFRYSVMTTNYGIGYHSVHQTRMCGAYTPNAWGLYDTHGNVAEWCWDWYGKSYYAESAGANPAGPAEGNHRVLRGGSFLSGQPACRSASRFWSAPGEAKYYIGFRVARDVVQEESPPVNQSPANQPPANQPPANQESHQEAVQEIRLGNPRSDGELTNLDHARAMGGLSPKHDSLLRSATIHIPRNQGGSVRLAVYVGGSLRDGPHAARLLFDFGSTPTGASGWVTLKHPTGVRIPAETPIWFAWKGSSERVSVMFFPKPAPEDSFQHERGRWDSKALGLQSDQPWPQDWPASDDGSFESARYACYLRLTPLK